MYSEKRKQMYLNHSRLKKILSGCRLNKRPAQKVLHHAYFDYTMSIALGYSSNYDDAVEMTNDAFLKIFKHIKNGELRYENIIASFVACLRVIVICSCIDHVKAFNKKEVIAGQGFSHAEIVERLNISEGLELGRNL